MVRATPNSCTIWVTDGTGRSGASSPDVNGHDEVRADGRVISWLAVTGYPGGWPVFLPAGCQGMATTPFPARARGRHRPEG